MYGAIVVLWLGSEPELTERRADLAVWATERQRRAQPLVAAGPSYPAELAEQVEALLEEARVAPAAPETVRALQRAEAVLLEHPELPQAAWLLAERYAIEAHASAADGSGEPTLHGALRARARQLEGARAAPVGSPPLPEPLTADGRVPEPSGTRPHDRVFIDGATAAGTLAPGRHHVLWMRGELRVWAGWIELEPGRPWSLSDPTSPCSALDLVDVEVDADTPRPASGVLCQRWAIARPHPTGGIDVAECTTTHCGSWLRVSRESQRSAQALPARDDVTGGWPGWATWTLVGAGAAAAAGVVLWRAGAFDRDEPSTEFVFTGPSAPLYRF